MLALVAVVSGQAPNPKAPNQQTPKRSSASWHAPRTPWGDPDLQGIWNNSTTTPLERPESSAGREFLTAEEAAARDAQAARAADGALASGDPGTYNSYWFEWGRSLRRTSLIVDPRDGRLPAYTPEAQKRLAARAAAMKAKGPEPADGPEDRNLAERCLTRGAPKMPGGYNNNFQIFQTPEYVAILQEMIHEVRIIPLKQQPHIHSGIRQWMGDSRGHWEGATLVVESTNFDDRIIEQLFSCCPGALGNLRLTERFTRVDAETIDFQYTVDDPQTWVKPWTASVPMRKSTEGIYEYACHEGNYALEAMLQGARVQEQQVSAKGATATEQLDIPQARVIVTTLQPKVPFTSSGHATNRVFVHLDDGVMTVKESGPAAKVEFRRGDVRWRPKSGAYAIENLGDRPIRILEIDLKGAPGAPPPATALDPPKIDPTHYTVTFENEFVRVLRIQFGPREKGPTHQHFLTRVIVNMNDQPSGKADTVRVSGAAIHEEVNDTDYSVQRVAVELK